MAARSRRARVADVHELALRMPHVTVVHGSRGNPVYQVGGKSFVFFRTPRPDAVDPVTGEREPASPGAASPRPSPSPTGRECRLSPDGRFVAGPVPDLPGLWVASGCNGSGFSSSLAIGEALAAWITGETPPPGMTDLAPGRFGPLTDDVLVSRGLWQYAHYYDPVAGPALSGS